jgi:hypothetical protein
VIHYGDHERLYAPPSTGPKLISWEKVVATDTSGLDLIASRIL